MSEVILGDAQGGMRLVYHSSGESSRWLKDISSPEDISFPIHVWPFASICVRGMRKNGRTDVMISNVLGGEKMSILIIRPDKKPDLVVSPMLKTKDKPYFADAFPYLMLSRFFTSHIC